MRWLKKPFMPTHRKGYALQKFALNKFLVFHYTTTASEIMIYFFDIYKNKLMNYLNSWLSEIIDENRDLVVNNGSDR